jgi:MFS family permease
MFVLGGMTFPLYSLAAAYTNDWTPPDQLMAAASQLVTVYGLGALMGPMIAAGMMSAFGTHSFFWTIAGMHVAIAAFVFYRLLAWRAPLMKAPWHEVSLPARAFFIPATAVAVGRRLRPRRHT